MATGSAYLVEHLPDANRSDRFWSDGFDGTGLNQLGICLMKLRQNTAEWARSQNLSPIRAFQLRL